MTHRMRLEARNKIKILIMDTIKSKFEKYTAETCYKPYFSALFDENVILQASIIQSLYTSFGMSIYEQISLILAEASGFEAERQYLLEGSLNDDTRLVIDRICYNPIGTYTKQQEIDEIRASIIQGDAAKHPDSTVDVFIRDPDNNLITLIDITTVKPNKKESRALRRKLLVWTALAYSQDPTINVNTYIGIPYNPYYPEEYSRSFVWDNCHRDEVLIQNDLWRIFAGYDVFTDLLEIFTEIGLEMKSEIRSFLGQEYLEVSDGTTARENGESPPTFV